jgi:hypothetical protein
VSITTSTVAAIASAVAALAAWAAVSVAARSGEDDRRRQRIADLVVVQEWLLSARELLDDPTSFFTSVDPIYQRLRGSIAVAGDVDWVVRSAAGLFGDTGHAVEGSIDGEARELAMGGLADAIDANENAIALARINANRSPRRWQLLRRWRERPRHVRPQSDSA